MMVSFGINNRDDFFRELLNDNKVEYDRNSQFDGWILWGLKNHYISGIVDHYGDNTEYQITRTITLSEEGKAFAEFSSL